MDHNLPVVTKKMWNIFRAVLFMLKKGISKSKIMLELNMIMKRGKIAGKTMIGNLMFHNHNHHSHTNLPREYEFSCSSSPAFKLSHMFQHHQDLVCAHMPPSPIPPEYDLETLNAVNIVLQKFQGSPMILGSRRSTLVRKVRVTDSPFPFQDCQENNGQVDEAAEEFIQKFYRQLKKQTKSH